jgi:hypothetical protein
VENVGGDNVRKRCCVNRGNVAALYRTKAQRSHSQIVKRTIINIATSSKFIISP